MKNRSSVYSRATKVALVLVLHEVCQPPMYVEALSCRSIICIVFTTIPNLILMNALYNDLAAGLTIISGIHFPLTRSSTSSNNFASYFSRSWIIEIQPVTYACQMAWQCAVAHFVSATTSFRVFIYVLVVLVVVVSLLLFIVIVEASSIMPALI